MSKFFGPFFSPKNQIVYSYDSEFRIPNSENSEFRIPKKIYECSKYVNVMDRLDFNTT